MVDLQFFIVLFAANELTNLTCCLVLHALDVQGKVTDLTFCVEQLFKTLFSL